MIKYPETIRRKLIRGPEEFNINIDEDIETLLNLNDRELLEEVIANRNLTKFLTEYDSKVLTEAKGEYPELEEQLRRLFPTLVGNWFSGTLFAEFPRETDKLMENVRGLNFKIWMDPHASRNAYTIPGIETLEGLFGISLLYQIPIIGQMIYILRVAQQIGRYQNILLNARSENKIVTYQSNPLKMAVYFTKGMLTDMTREEKTAILLHEMGHWAYMKPIIAMHTAALLSLLIVTIPITYFVVLFSARRAEYRADKYVKDMGYAEELGSAFDRFMQVRSDVNFYSKMGDFFVRIILKYQNFVEKYLPFLIPVPILGGFGHPSMEKRKKAIGAENINNYPVGKLLRETHIPISESDTTRTLKMLSPEGEKVFKPLCRMVDKPMAKMINRVSPGFNRRAK